MASDISSIIKSEIVNTLESLLSVSGQVNDVSKVESSDLTDTQCIKVSSNFDFSGISSTWTFFVPTAAGTQFEYLMLGGIADLKSEIDDEIADAVKEIVSTISGSITTSVNAQGFDDISGMKFTLGDSRIVSCDDESIDNMFEFKLQLNDDDLTIYLQFDSKTNQFISELTGESPLESTSNTSEMPAAQGGATNSILSTILGEDSVDNLRLLFDIKLRLSVRLGNKTCLLRDVISWDIGEIIELNQMTNEPLDILVNGVVIGEGEAVIVDGKFGVKIKNIGEHKLI